MKDNKVGFVTEYGFFKHSNSGKVVPNGLLVLATGQILLKYGLTMA